MTDNFTVSYSLVYECLQRKICIVVAATVGDETINYYFRRVEKDADKPMKFIECYKLAPSYMGDVYKLLGKRFTFPSFQAHLDKMTISNLTIDGWVDYRPGSMVTKQDTERAYRRAMNTYHTILREMVMEKTQKSTQDIADEL